MHSDSLRGYCHDAHDHQDKRDHCIFAFEIIVGPADQIKHDPPPYGEARDQEYGSADQASDDASNIDVAGLREAY